MELPNYNLSQLFEQIGLPSSEHEIEEFIKSHQLSKEIRFEDAPFWNASQSRFFEEARDQDAVWAELVDELDTLLHKDSMKRRAD